MIGHQQIISCRMNGIAPSDIFVHLDDHPKNGHPENQIANGELPVSVWAGETSPARADLSWAHGLTVHLIPGKETTIQKYVAWWIAFIESKPKLLVGIDTDMEFNEWIS